MKEMEKGAEARERNGLYDTLAKVERDRKEAGMTKELEHRLCEPRPRVPTAGELAMGIGYQFRPDKW